MKALYLTLSLLPTAAVVSLAWYLLRAISVRIVWREPEDHLLDDRGVRMVWREPEDRRLDDRAA